MLDYATEYHLRRLIHRSTKLQDRGQVEELAQLFSQGEIVFGGAGQVFRGTQGVSALLKRNRFYDANGNPADPNQVYATARALHYLSNVDIYEGDAGTLSAESLFLIVQQVKESPRIVIGGRYLDTFGEAEGCYHFKRRIVEVHFVGDTDGYLTSHPWVP
jgi:hypothetical protein